MRVLVTRPMADAVPFAKLVQAAGLDVVIEPMIRIRPVPAFGDGRWRDLDRAGGLLFTSANGVRVFAEHSARRDIKAWCVGKGSADAARKAGFAKVGTAGGDVDKLAAHVAAHSAPEAGPLVHIAGSHRAGNLAAALAGLGFEVRRLVLYQAVARDALTAHTIDALQAGRIDVLTLFSPRTARLFTELAGRAGLRPALGNLTALSLSPAVSDALDLPVRRRMVAADRHQPAMLEALGGLA